MSDIGYGRHRVSVAVVLTEEQLADLYAWLVQQFPRAEDPVANGFIGPRHNVTLWRDGVLNQLVARGTPEACAAIRRLIPVLTDEADLLRWNLLRAEEVTRQHTWIAPEPRDILAVGASSERRLVRNGDQLLDVLIEPPPCRRNELPAGDDACVWRLEWPH